MKIKMKKILEIFLLLTLFTFALLSVNAESVDLSGLFSANAGAQVSLTNENVKLVNGICVDKNTNQPVNGIVSVYGIATDGHRYLAKKIEYKNGLKNSKCCTYAPNGSVEWDATFLDGNLEGQTKHYMGENWIEYYNIKNNELVSYGYELGRSKGVLSINQGGHPYGWLNNKKFSSSEAQRLANQALENVKNLRTTIFICSL
jgi:antitoxin component YwqK of YwqJK toxin-antitoxin module